MTTSPSKHDAREVSSDRRNFLKKAWAALGMLAGVEFLGAGIAFLWSNKEKTPERDRSKLLAVGAIDDFAPNSVTAFRPGRLFISRLEDGGLLALSLKCPHLGCSIGWQAEAAKFACPCHSSSFDKTGNVLSPPASRALDVFPVVIQNGEVLVHTGKPLKRQRFVKSQATYA